MTDNVTMTRAGGFYYRALAYHWAFVAVVVVPVLILTLLALINPFWFRNAMFSNVERWVNKLARHRDRVKYRLYLGTDPAVWHALKDKR
jgi:hypothetical protein